MVSSVTQVREPMRRRIPGFVIYGPADDVPGLLKDGRTRRHRGTHRSGLVVKAAARLWALMTSALLLLINVAALMARDQVRVWSSRSDRSCHRCARAPGIGEHPRGSPLGGMLLCRDLGVRRLAVRQERPHEPGMLVRPHDGRTVLPPGGR